MKLKIKKYMVFLIAAVFILTSVSSVASARIGILSNKSDYEDKGEIFSRDITMKSGFLIKGENGVTFFGKHFDTYLPINLAKEFKESGLEVEFSFKVSFSNMLSLSGLSKLIRGILPIRLNDIRLVEPEPETDLVFDISLDSTETIGAVPLTATLKNEGEKEVLVSEMALEIKTLNFNIITPDGETLEYIGPMERRMPNVVALNPGETITVEIEDITKEGMFGIPGEDSYDFKPGSYAVQGLYTSGNHEPTVDVEEIYEGTLESSIQNFEVLDDTVETKILTLEADPVSITQDVFSLLPEPIEYLAILDNRIHAVYDKGADVDITASVEYDNYIFESWEKDASGEGNTVTIVMNDDKEVIGKYTEEENTEEGVYYNLTIFARGCGTTSPSPGEHQYLEDSEVNIEAIIPKMDGCVFVQWKGDDIEGSTNLEETLVIDSDKRVTAIFECIPVADFIYNPAQPKSGEEIVFTSTSTQACREIATYKWDFGDGVTEVLDKPVIKHSYAEGGTYLVTLTVLDDKEK